MPTFAIGKHGGINNAPEVVAKVEETLPHEHRTPHRLLELLLHTSGQTLRQHLLQFVYAITIPTPPNNHSTSQNNRKHTHNYMDEEEEQPT